MSNGTILLQGGAPQWDEAPAVKCLHLLESLHIQHIVKFAADKATAGHVCRAQCCSPCRSNFVFGTEAGSVLRLQGLRSSRSELSPAKHPNSRFPGCFPAVCCGGGTGESSSADCNGLEVQVMFAYVCEKQAPTNSYDRTIIAKINYRSHSEFYCALWCVMDRCTVAVGRRASRSYLKSYRRL